MRIKKIISEDQILAIIIPYEFNIEGVHFITENESSLQLAFIKSAKKSSIKRHLHPEFIRQVNCTMECLFIRNGKLKIEFYNEDREYIDKYVASRGDVILFTSGGHGIKYIENSELIEIRQGPYNKKMDKVFF